MIPTRNFAVLATLTGPDRTAFKRDTIKPAISDLAPAWKPSDIANWFAQLLPHLEPDERAEVIAAVLAKADYHPFRDGLHYSDVIRPGFVLDAKSVQYRFSYKSRPEEASRQAAAFRATGGLPGLIIVYQGKTKDHRIVFLPGLLRPNVSVTLNRVEEHADHWAWNQAKPVGILISQDRDDLAKFLSHPAHVAEALTNMETAMAAASKVRKNNSQMDKDWNEISKETMALVLRTDIGQDAIKSAERKGRKAGAKSTERRIYLALCEKMSEAEARRVTGYTGP